MDRDKFLNLVEILSAEEFNFVYLYHSGEPFLHPDIFQFIRALKEKGIRVNVATKLSCVIDWDLYSESPPDELLVTLDTLNPDIAKQISPGLDFDLVLANTNQLSKYWKNLPVESREQQRLFFNTTVTRLNRLEIEDIFKWLECRFKVFDSPEPVHYGPKAMGLCFGCVSKEEIQETIEAGGDLLSNEFNEVRFRIEGGNIIPLYDKRCWPNGRECDMTPVVGWDGSLLPCCHDFLYRCSMGNVFEAQSIDNILTSPTGERILEGGHKFRLSICKVCN